VRAALRSIRESVLVVAASAAALAPHGNAAHGIAAHGIAPHGIAASGPAASGFSPPQGSGLRLPPVAPAGTAPDSEVLAPADWLGSSTAVDESGTAPVFVEVESARTTAFVGELLAIEVRFGLDAEFLLESVIPLFRRQLDVPVQIAADWLDDAESLELTRAFVELARESQVSVARNDRLALARRLPDRSVNGRTFRVYALDVRRIERAPGTLRLASPRLHFARATAFTEDFVNGRTPTERRDAYVVGRGLEIEIAPLPEEVRPANFSGAVGEFRIEARIEAGAASARYELVLQGQGDLSLATVPDAASFPGYRVLGVLDDRGRARRTITYDLARSTPGDERIEGVDFAYFDPRPPGRYVEVVAPSLASPPSSVVPTPLATPMTGGAETADAIEPTEGSRAAYAAFLGAAVALASFLVLRWRARKRPGTGGGPA